MRMLRIALSLIVAAVALVAAAASAQAPPAAASATAGKALHDKDCIACHARQFGGDPARIYVRPDRRVQTPAQLRAQVAFCNSQLGTSWFPDEEEHVAAYLNLQYYKFKP